jgi:hypothetical protein
MNLPRIPSAGLLLAGAAVWAACGNVWAQTWRQDVWQDAQTTDSAAAPATGWHARGQMPTAPLKQPTESAIGGRQRVKWVSEAEVIPPGTPQLEPMIPEEAFLGGGGGGGGGCSHCGGPGGEACGCDPCDGPECGQACDFGYEIFDGRCHRWLRDFSFFVGGDAFKGPRDYGRNGNFGLNEGLNLAGPLGDPWGCGYQIGANFVQSNFSGAPRVETENYTLFAPCRRQTFVTAALFHRAQCRGFQWGVAFDYLHDDYYEQTDLKQIRSETGFVINDCYEIGYYGAYGLGSERTIDGRLDPTDMFVVYLRRYFETGGEGRLWGGATGNGDGLLGADLWLPLGKGFALENRINYMIPKQGTGDTAQPRESWGFVIQLVWYPGQNAACMKQNPFRAMFNVADNSLFMVDRLAQ